MKSLFNDCFSFNGMTIVSLRFCIDWWKLAQKKRNRPIMLAPISVGAGTKIRNSYTFEHRRSYNNFALTGEKKWFSTNAFQSDAMEESCQKACNNSDNKGESDDLTPSSYVYCDVCGDLCDGETLKPFEKDVWIHQNCFKCAICKKDLDPCLYFVS